MDSNGQLLLRAGFCTLLGLLAWTSSYTVSPSISIGYVLMSVCSLLNNFKLNNAVIPLLASTVLTICSDRGSAATRHCVSVGIALSYQASIRPLLAKLVNVKWQSIDIALFLLICVSFVGIDDTAFENLKVTTISMTAYVFSKNLGIDEREIVAFALSCASFGLLSMNGPFEDVAFQCLGMSIVALFAILGSVAMTFVAAVLFGFESLLRRLVGVLFLVVNILLAFFPICKALTGTNFVLFVVQILENDAWLILGAVLYWVLVIATSSLFAFVAFNKLHWSRIWCRKIFHFAIVAIIVPALFAPALYPFLVLSLGGVVCVFSLLEFGRIVLFPEPLRFISSYFRMFLVESESQHGESCVIMAHFSLIVACMVPIWLKVAAPHFVDASFASLYEGTLFPFLGVLTVGISDSSAAMVGSTWGKWKWPGQSKTFLGSIAGFVSLFLSLVLLSRHEERAWGRLLVASLITSLSEVFVTGNDNFTLPVVFVYSMVVLQQW